MEESPILLELSDICKHYTISEAENQILDHIHFSLERGQSAAIVGPSGSGKTTLLNLIGLLDTPTCGSIRFENIEVSSMSLNERALIRNQKIGFVFQLHYLLPQLTLMENILLPLLPERDRSILKQATQHGIAMLERVGLHSKADRFPGQLSVGECQRGAVVRALINQPVLVLADEPTGSLDHDTGTLVSDLLIDLCRDSGTGLITVTHSAELAARMKRVYELRNGKIHLK